MSVQTTITRQDPAIEAYRLGLLSDVQGLVQNQMLGQQVQNLRAQGLSNAEVAERLGTLPGIGVEGDDDFRAPRPYTAEDVAQVPIDAQFSPSDFQVAGLTQNQRDAAQLAARGVGSYQPFVEGGLQALQGGIPDLAASSLGGLREAQIAQDIAGQGLGFGRLGTQSALADLRGASDQSSTIGNQFQQQAQDVANRGRAQASFAQDQFGGVSQGAQRQAARAQGQFGRVGQAARRVAAQARLGGQGVLGRQAAGLARAEDTMAQNVARGQAQMGQAVDRARASTGRATDALYGAGDASRGIAADVTGRARGLQDPLEGRLLGSTAGGLGEAQRGQIGADEAARLARLSTARSQDQLGRAADFGMGTAQAGIAGLLGASEEFNPYSAYNYMNPFEDAAVQQAMRDIQRAGDVQSQNLAAQAVQSGAFGGSRRAVAEAELGRNILEQQGRTAGQMRQAGFQSAAERAQQAFEQARQRQIGAAQTTGQLGQAGAGTSAQAAQAAGQLGLGAEQLAQTGALQGAQLGLSSRQFEAANAKAIADTGLNIEQLAAQTGLNAQQIAGNFAQAAGQMGLQTEQMAAQTAERAANLGMTEAQFQAANQQALASTGMNVEQLAAQTGMNAQQLAGQMAQQSFQAGLSGQQLAGQMAQQSLQAGLSGEQLAGQMAQQSGQMGMDAARMRQAGAQQAGALSQGLGSLMGSTAANMAQVGLSARQQQAANAAQRAQMGIQMAGLGELEQTMRDRDINTLMQTGGMLQAQDQGVLDAIRASNTQRYQQPFQQLGFLSDVYAGIPTSQSTQTMTSGSNASPFMQAATLGIAGLSGMAGAARAGIL